MFLATFSSAKLKNIGDCASWRPVLYSTIGDVIFTKHIAVQQDYTFQSDSQVFLGTIEFCRSSGRQKKSVKIIVRRDLKFSILTCVIIIFTRWCFQNILIHFWLFLDIEIFELYKFQYGLCLILFWSWNFTLVSKALIAFLFSLKELMS